MNLTPDTLEIVALATDIPIDVLEKALALETAAKAHPALSLAVTFHVPGSMSAVPTLLTGDRAAMSQVLVGTGISLQLSLGLVQADTCDCPTCRARRGESPLKEDVRVTH